MMDPSSAAVARALDAFAATGRRLTDLAQSLQQQPNVVGVTDGSDFGSLRLPPDGRTDVASTFVWWINADLADDVGASFELEVRWHRHWRVEADLFFRLLAGDRLGLLRPISRGTASSVDDLVTALDAATSALTAAAPLIDDLTLIDSEQELLEAAQRLAAVFHQRTGYEDWGDEILNAVRDAPGEPGALRRLDLVASALEIAGVARDLHLEWPVARIRHYLDTRDVRMQGVAHSDEELQSEIQALAPDMASRGASSMPQQVEALTQPAGDRHQMLEALLASLGEVRRSVTAADEPQRTASQWILSRRIDALVSSVVSALRRAPLP